MSVPSGMCHIGSGWTTGARATLKANPPPGNEMADRDVQDVRVVNIGSDWAMTKLGVSGAGLVATGAALCAWTSGGWFILGVGLAGIGGVILAMAILYGLVVLLMVAGWSVIALPFLALFEILRWLRGLRPARRRSTSSFT